MAFSLTSNPQDRNRLNEDNLPQYNRNDDPYSWDGENIKRDFVHPPIPSDVATNKGIISTMALLISFFGVLTLQNIITSIAGNIMYMLPVAYKGKVVFNVSIKSARVWSVNHIMAIGIVPVLVPFIIAILCTTVYRLISRKQRIARMLLMWGTLVGISFTAASLIAAPLSKARGLGFTFQMLRLPASYAWVAFAVGICSLYFFGMFYGRAMIKSFYSQSFLQADKTGRVFRLYGILVPVLFTSVIAMLVFFVGGTVADTLTLIPIIALVIIATPLVAMFSTMRNNLTYEEDAGKVKYSRSRPNYEAAEFPVVLIAAATFLVLAYYLVFNHGIGL